jgi:twitching motility protein PilT
MSPPAWHIGQRGPLLFEIGARRPRNVDAHTLRSPEEGIRVAILDRYLDALRTPGAQAMTFRSGAPVELIVNGTPRAVSKGVPTVDQLRALLTEVLPPDYRYEPDGIARDFPYEGAIGRVRLTVKIGESGIRLRATPWGAQTPASQADTMVIEPVRQGTLPSVQRIASGVAAKPHHASNVARVIDAPSPKPQRIDELFHQMLDMQASDLHMKSNAPPMVRAHGEMCPMEGRSPLTPEELWELIEPIMPPRNREQFEETRDTDFSYELGGRARMRCNVFKDIVGVGGVFRQIPANVMSAKELGLPASVLKLCEHRKGLVLVTGPTGSGKSTTLAAMIDYVNDTRSDHIITIEDPVEFVHKDKRCLINQREIGASTMSFKTALRAALREDPDVVLVGELRDLETTAIAIETAETGHLVFATLHTNTAASTVERLINQYPADRQQQIRSMLAESLVGVVSQALCRRKGGGRVAAVEVLVVTAAVSNLIREEKTFQIPTMMQTGRALGMQTLNDALLQLVKSGAIEPAEAYATSLAKKEMALALTRANHRGAWSEEGAA